MWNIEEYQVHVSCVHVCVYVCTRVDMCVYWCDVKLLIKLSQRKEEGEVSYI